MLTLGRTFHWCILHLLFIYDVAQSPNEGGVSILHQGKPNLQLKEVSNVHVYIFSATYFSLFGYSIIGLVYNIQIFFLIGHPYYNIWINFSVPP